MFRHRVEAEKPHGSQSVRSSELVVSGTPFRMCPGALTQQFR
jgi:hypothetical protein